MNEEEMLTTIFAPLRDTVRKTNELMGRMSEVIESGIELASLAIESNDDAMTYAAREYRRQVELLIKYSKENPVA